MRSNPLSVFLLKPHRAFFLCLDMAFTVGTLFLAFYLPFDGNIPSGELEACKTLLPFLLVSRAICLIYLSFYNRFWEYSSLEDLLQIVKGIALSSLVAVTVLLLYNRAFLIPRSILVIEGMLAIAVFGGSRLFW